MEYKACGTIFASVCLIAFFSSCGAVTSGNSRPSVVAIMMTSGSPQTATAGTPFAAPLTVTATTGGVPTSGVSVTFTAPTTGASGTFGNGTASETDTTNASGVAHSSTFTANSVTGSYAVTAVAPAKSTPANFSLTNTGGVAAMITATIFQNTTNPQGQTIYNNGTQAVSTFDSLIVFIFIGIILGMAVSAMFVEAHPAFAFIGIFTLILLLIITAVVHNVYFDIIQSSVFAGGVTPSGATVIFFEYLPLFGAVAWALIMVATYGKGVSGAGASGSGAQQRAYG